MDQISTLSELEVIKNKFSKYYLLIHKSSSDVSQCALNHIKTATEIPSEEYGVGEVDVLKSSEIHGEFNINTVPTLVVFENGILNNVIKGCMDETYYSALLKGELSSSNNKSREGNKTKNVIVYSTPSCSWCTKIKQHLNANNISFREIDVASDPSKAEEMKRKSGQMGVPQTEIDGQMIVGFDRPKIDRLLEIA